MAGCYYVLCLRFVFYLIVITCDTLIKSYLLTYKSSENLSLNIEHVYFMIIGNLFTTYAFILVNTYDNFRKILCMGTKMSLHSILRLQKSHLLQELLYLRDRSLCYVSKIITCMQLFRCKIW